MIKVVSEDPCTPDVAVMLDELSEVLSVITGSSGKSSFDVNDVRVENARFVVARDPYGKAVGCGAFRPLESSIAEIKRMYSRRSIPGVGSAILSFLETEALKLGFAALRLETRLVNEKAVTCLVSCDHIPRRSMPLLRAKAVLDELIAGFPKRSPAHRSSTPERPTA